MAKIYNIKIRLTHIHPTTFGNNKDTHLLQRDPRDKFEIHFEEKNYNPMNNDRDTQIFTYILVFDR